MSQDDWVNASEIHQVAYCPQKLAFARRGKKIAQPEAAVLARQLERGNQYHQQAAEAALAQTGSKRCYIATYALGPNHPTTQHLREWRDRSLRKSFAGRCLVEVYYLVSPLLILLFWRQTWFARLTQRLVIRFDQRWVSKHER